MVDSRLETKSVREYGSLQEPTKRDNPMEATPIWTHGETLKRIKVSNPRLASWDRHDLPSQKKLREYLNEIRRSLGSLPSGIEHLGLHMNVAVEKPSYLLQQHDLDNYLYPVVKELAGELGPTRFKYVSATKKVRGDSYGQWISKPI